MTPFEEQMRKALAREEPSEGFADRVLAAASAPRPATPRRFPRWIAAIAAGLVLASGGALEYRRYQGERAKERVLLAVRMAGKEFNKVQRKVIDLRSEGQ